MELDFRAPVGPGSECLSWTLRGTSPGSGDMHVGAARSMPGQGEGPFQASSGHKDMIIKQSKHVTDP